MARPSGTKRGRILDLNKPISFVNSAKILLHVPQLSMENPDGPLNAIPELIFANDIAKRIPLQPEPAAPSRGTRQLPQMRPAWREQGRMGSAGHR